MLSICTRRSTLLGLGFLAVVTGLTASAPATNTIRNAFVARYPTSTLLTRMQSSAGETCLLCHAPTDRADPGNCYKEAIAARIGAGRTAAQALADVELLDSDGDGTSNLAEITMPRSDLPGQVGYNPGLIGATGTDPCGLAASSPISHQRETPLPAACNLADITNIGDTGAGPDHQLTVDDLIVFVNAFSDAAGCPGAAGSPCNRADVTGIGGPPEVADGQLTVDDIIAFVNAFSTGC